MVQSEKEIKKAKQDKLVSRILFIPIVILLAIVPLIVRVSLVQLGEAEAHAMHTNLVADFFSQGKAVGIIVFSVIAVIMLFLFFNKENIKKDKKILIYLIATGIFLGFTFLSSMLSENRDVAMSGAADRAEGFWIIACYAILFLYTVYVFRAINDYKYVIGSISVLVVITTILGVFQYFGKDLLMGEAFRKIIFPKEYLQYADNMGATYESGKIYGTMYHYNYMGSFGAIIVPMFVTMTLFITGYKKKIFLAFMSLCSLFLLLGSTSRAGLIGVAISVIVAILAFGKVIIRKWKLTVPIVAILVVILIGFNVLTGGTIFERIPTLVNDAIGIFMPGDENFDYKAHIPVKDVTMQDGKATIVFQNDTITLELVDGGISIQDSAGNPIEYILEDDVYTTQDERFSNVQFKTGKLTEEAEYNNGLTLLMDNKLIFVFKVDQEEGIHLVDPYTFEPIELEEAPSWGFEGKEKLGSARGYIWSRSIPMLKETILLGNGPDTFAIEFPQNDYLAKWWAYDTPNMIVDKPHNLYLQIAINEGIIALLAFLTVVGLYIVDSMRLYAFKEYYQVRQVVGIATMLGVVGYLGAGIFNDSVVSVAPIFWILLGVGVAINYINNGQDLAIKKQSKVIPFK